MFLEGGPTIESMLAYSQFNDRPIGKAVPSDDRSVLHDHRGSMPPTDLGTARDLIEVEQTAGTVLMLGTQCT
jgi:hypothetical protein